MRKATLLAALLTMGALIGTADAGAHTSTRAPIIHQIDHVRGKTNEVRALVGPTSASDELRLPQERERGLPSAGAEALAVTTPPVAGDEAAPEQRLGAARRM